MTNSQLTGKKRVRKTYPCPCEDCNGDYQTTQTIGKHTMRTAARHGAQDASYKPPPKPGCKWCTCPRHPNGKWVTNGTFYRHKQRIVRPPAIAAPVAIQSEIIEETDSDASDMSVDLHSRGEIDQSGNIDEFDSWNSEMEIDTETTTMPDIDEIAQVAKEQRLRALQELVDREAEEAELTHQYFLDDLVDDASVREDDGDAQSSVCSDSGSDDKEQRDGSVIPLADNSTGIPAGTYYIPNLRAYTHTNL